ncbi:putative mating-type protein mat1 [Diaporthe ampelina]|uniref:Putative mating-type protein mat1 n=1 Tax=Diaporthe ampelina TaxID=1214573 RepID=A0A0G2H859_9PEZI|nr:putative mating-type protein mat1 [Diaporthe ampelina]
MADMKPKMTAVHDGQGRMAIYVDESMGQDRIVSVVGPRYQQAVIHGEPCTIFFDKNARMFCIAPVFYKQELVDRPGRYDHIIDLDWLPGAGPSAPSAPTVATGNTDDTGNSTSGGAEEEEEGDALSTDEMDVDEQAPATTGSPQSNEKIPRPPNSWILFRMEKSKELREANPSMSAGEVSTEAARQWKALSDEAKVFYQEMAKEAALQHKMQYPDYRYKPGRK